MQPVSFKRHRFPPDVIRLACIPASRIDQRPAPNVGHAKKRQAHDSHREMSLELWSVFDAR
jgi:hypothetical protein